ncbi:hypothetical protein K3495_g4246 [Podosphaera aphanis]|nr:hypothetical protein K3495_g4246 [Podosphaera aphanis]
MKIFLPRFGIQTKFIEGFNADDFSRAINKKTKALHFESIGNLGLNIPDFRAIADVAYAHGVPLVADNTLGAGGFFIRPIEHGADIVDHSATK